MQTVAPARLLDTAVFDLIAQEKTRQTHGLELIASENYASEQVMAAQGSVLTNKYAEGLPGKRYYGGCEIVDQVEQLAIDRVKELFGVAWANVQPHSGAQANAAVFLACLKPGDKILGFDLSHGGHLTHGSPVNFSGKYFVPSFYGVEKETGLIDWANVKEIARRERPKMIICGASAYSRDWNYAALREAADEVGALLLADISHPSGLIVTGLLNSPFRNASESRTVSSQRASSSSSVAFPSNRSRRSFSYISNRGHVQQYSAGVRSRNAIRYAHSRPRGEVHMPRITDGETLAALTT